MREALNLKEETEPLQGLTKVGKSANWWWAYKNIAFVCERPNKVSFDTDKRLHCENAPAVRYPDGWGVYVWHGVRVPMWIIEHPETITLEKINNENNAEIRRILIERYGIGRYLLDSGAEKLHQDWSGELYKQPRRGGTPIYAVRVVNRTPESDGTYKEYWLRIDPNAYKGDAGRFAQAAVASTWHRRRDGSLAYADWRDYHPQYES